MNDTSFVYKPHDLYDAPFDCERCKRAVPHRGRRVGFYQCLRKPWKDGWCKQHHPDTIKARQEKAQRHYEAEQKNSPYAVIARLRENLQAATARAEAAESAASRWQAIAAGLAEALQVVNSRFEDAASNCDDGWATGDDFTAITEAQAALAAYDAAATEQEAK